MQVMVGVSKPLQGSEKRAPGRQQQLRPADDLGKQHAVRSDGKMMPVLLDCRDRKDHRRIRSEGCDAGPGKVDKIHKGAESLGMSFLMKSSTQAQSNGTPGINSISPAPILRAMRVASPSDPIILPPRCH